MPTPPMTSSHAIPLPPCIADMSYTPDKCRISPCQQKWKLPMAGGPPIPFHFSFPFESRGCPVLAFFARAGSDAACTMGVVMPSGLHRTYGAHHLHFITGSCYQDIEIGLGRHLRFPSFAECAKDGAPTVLVTYAESRTRATRPHRPRRLVLEGDPSPR